VHRIRSTAVRLLWFVHFGLLESEIAVAILPPNATCLRGCHWLVGKFTKLLVVWRATETSSHSPAAADLPLQLFSRQATVSPKKCAICLSIMRTSVHKLLI
jgi:hypothetical protein